MVHPLVGLFRIKWGVWRDAKSPPILALPGLLVLSEAFIDSVRIVLRSILMAGLRIINSRRNATQCILRLEQGPKRKAQLKQLRKVCERLCHL